MPASRWVCPRWRPAACSRSAPRTSRRPMPSASPRWASIPTFNPTTCWSLRTGSPSSTFRASSTATPPATWRAFSSPSSSSPAPRSTRAGAWTPCGTRSSGATGHGLRRTLRSSRRIWCGASPASRPVLAPTRTGFPSRPWRGGAWWRSSHPGSGASPRSGLRVSVANLLAALRARPLVAIVAVGAVVRLALFAAFHSLDLLMDEVQYQELAVNLAEGRGFLLNGLPTSWRPPLYPFTMAALYLMTGTTNPAVVRLFQALLSLGTCVVIFALVRRLFGERAALVPAGIVAFYPSLLLYNNHILTEVLFTFLLSAAALAIAAYLDTRRPAFLVAGGVALGLTVLTREILWPTVPLMALLVLFLAGPGPVRRVTHAAALVIPFALVIAPWVVRNTIVQGSPTFIATNGGIVFYEGNYEHTPLDRPSRSHAIDPELKVRRLLPPGLSEADRQRAAFAKGLEFIREHPGLTLRRSLIKVANLWGLERELIGLLLRGGYGPAGRLTTALVALAICGAYVAIMLGGVVGLCVALRTSGLS